MAVSHVDVPYIDVPYIRFSKAYFLDFVDELNNGGAIVKVLREST